MNSNPTLELREATRLASLGKYKCRACNRIDNQENGVVIAFAGNVLLALCPECITGPIILSRRGGAIQIEMPKPKDSQLVLASDLSSAKVGALATPNVQKTEF